MAGGGPPDPATRSSTAAPSFAGAVRIPHSGARSCAGRILVWPGGSSIPPGVGCHSMVPEKSGLATPALSTVSGPAVLFVNWTAMICWL